MDGASRVRLVCEDGSGEELTSDIGVNRPDVRSLVTGLAGALPAGDSRQWSVCVPDASGMPVAVIDADAGTVSYIVPADSEIPWLTDVYVEGYECDDVAQAELAAWATYLRRSQGAFLAS